MLKLGTFGDKMSHNIIDHVLKPQYRGHEVEFWVALQTLHDIFNHWCKEGLTELGKSFVANLKTRWT